MTAKRAQSRDTKTYWVLDPKPRAPLSIKELAQMVGAKPPALYEWYTAFDVTPGDKRYLAPEKRVRIW